MHLRTLRFTPNRAISTAAVLLPLCMMAGLSCGDWRASTTKSERVDRTTCTPHVAHDAAAAAGATAIGDAGAEDAAPPTDASADADATDASADAAIVSDASADATVDAAALADASTDASTPRANVERAILVSVDGLGGRYIDEQFAKGKLPGFAALQQAGSSTLNARSDYDNNYTLPNHTTILTGRPVSRDMDLPANVHHGWTINSTVDASYTLHNAGNAALKYIASVFDVAHDHGKKTCLYAGKLKFSVFSNSYNAVNGAVDMVGDDNGRNKIDRVVLLESSTELLISTAEGDLAGGVCDFAFIHITDLDTIGHGMGWGSESWLTGLDQVDRWIKRLSRFTNVDDAGTPFGLVVTADHGGGDSGHGDPTDLWCYQIPFFAVGPGFTPNTDLYALVGSTRCEPGLVRLRYSAIPQPIRNADAPNVILNMLGLPPVPGSVMRNLLAQK